MKFLLRERLKSVSAIESRYGSSLRPLHPRSGQRKRIDAVRDRRGGDLGQLRR